MTWASEHSNRLQIMIKITIKKMLSIECMDLSWKVSYQALKFKQAWWIHSMHVNG